MNNSTEVNVERKHSTKENGKTEVAIDIEENTKDSKNSTDVSKTESADKTIVNIKTELRDNTRRKPPAIWVQYNQAYGQGQEYGRGPHQNYGGGHHYGGEPLEYDPQSRNLFVKWVFIILLVMFIITAAIAIFILTTIILVGMNYVMACSACARVPPCNFISLFIVVLAMSNLVGAITVRYKTHILIFAVIATVVTVAVCVLLACSNFDFTKWYLYVVVIAVAFVAISMTISIAMLVMNVRYKPLQIVMLFAGGLINVVILVMELQMILGGKAIEMGEDDYALAAYLIYSSIVDIFLKIVQIMGLLDD